MRWATRSAELSPRIFTPFSQSVFTMGEGQGMRAYTLTPYPSPKIKAFWERGIILLKIRGDNLAQHAHRWHYATAEI